MVLPNFVQKALRDEPIPIYGDGRQRRNFTYVGDAVEGILRLMATPAAVGQVFNMGGSEETSIEELARRVRAVCGSRSPLQYVPYSCAYSAGFEDMQRRRRTPANCERPSDSHPPRRSTRSSAAWRNTSAPEMEGSSKP